MKQQLSENMPEENKPSVTTEERAQDIRQHLAETARSHETVGVAQAKAIGEATREFIPSQKSRILPFWWGIIRVPLAGFFFVLCNGSRSLGLFPCC